MAQELLYPLPFPAVVPAAAAEGVELAREYEHVVDADGEEEEGDDLGGFFFFFKNSK